MVKPDVSEFQGPYDDACGKERHYSCQPDLHMRVDEEGEHWIDLEGKVADEVGRACELLGITAEELLHRAVEEFAEQIVLGEAFMDALELEHEMRMKEKEKLDE